MKLSRDDNVKQLVVEFQNGKFSECEKEAISLLEHYKDDYFLLTLFSQFTNIISNQNCLK